MPLKYRSLADMQQRHQQVGADESDFSLESRGFFGDTLSLVGRAGISTLETLENAAEFFNLDDDPKSMASKLREFEIFKPDFEEAMDEGWLQDTWAGSIPQAMESAGPSLAVAGMGFLTGAAVTPIFPLAGGVIGAALASLGIMGTAEYQNTYESAIEMGKSEEEAKSVAWQTGVIEGLGESAASVIGLGFGKLPANMAIRGLTKFVRRPLGESLDALTKVSMKDFATSLGQTYTAEQLTEFAQAFGQTRALREADMTDQGMVESLAKTIIPTLFMTGGFQMATTGLNMNEKRKLRAGLKSDSEVKRAEALNAITHMLAVEDQGLAEKFHIFAREQIKAGAVDFNMDFAGFADELITAHEAKVAPSPLASQISATDVLTGRISEDTVMNIMEKDLQSQNVVKKNDIMSQFMGLAGARLASTEEVAQADQEILQELEAELVVARGKVYKADGTKRARVSAKAEADLAELEQEYNDATAKLTTGGITTGILRPTVSAPTGRAEGVTKGMLKGQIPKTGIKKGISEQLEKPEDVEIAPEEEVLVGMRQRREALNKTIRERQDALTPEATGILVDQIVQLDQEILQMERALNLAPRKETAPTREELLVKEPGTLTDREQRQAYEERDRIDSELADPNLSLEDRTRLMGEYYHLGILGQIPEGVGQITEEELTEQALAATPEEGVTPEYSTLVYELTAKQESIVQEMDDNNLDKFERAQIRWSQANTNYNQAKEVGNKNMMRIAGEYREAAENTMKLMLARGGDPTARKAVAPDSLLQSRQQALAVYKILRDAVTTRFGKDRRPFTGTGMRGATQASKLDVKEAETLGQLELETKEGTVRTKEITVIGDKIGETGIDGLTDEELVTIHNYYEELVGKLPSEREFTLPQQKAMIREFGLMIGQEALGEQLGFGTEIGLEDATRQLLEAAKEEGGLSSSDFYKELGDILGGMTEVKYSTLLEQDKTITERKVDLPNEVIEWFHDEAMAVGNYRSTGYVGHPRGIEGQVFYVFKQAADEYVVFQGDYDANDGFQGERAGNTAPLYEDANGDPVIFKSRVAAAEAAAEYARGLGSTEWIKFKDQNGIVEYKISPEGTDSVYMILSATNEVSKNKWVVYKDGEVFMNLTPKGKETTNFSGSQGQVKARVEELAGFTTSGTTAINRANKAREEAFKEKQELWGKKHTGKAPEMLAATDYYYVFEPVLSQEASEARWRRETAPPAQLAGDKYAGQEMTPEMRQRIKDEIDARTDDLTRLQVEANHRTRMNKILKEANERAAKPTPEAGKVMDDIASLQRALLTFDGATITRDVSDKKFITEKGGIRKKGKQEGDIGIQEVTTEPAPPTPDVTVPGDVPTAPQEMVEEALKDVEGLIERSLMGILARGLGFEAPPPRPLSEIQAQIEEEGKTPRGTGGVVPAPVRPPQTPTVALPTQPGQQPIELTQEQIDEMRAQRTEERKEIDEQWEQDAGLFVLENLRALEKQLGRPLRTAESETQVLDLLRRMSRGEMVDPGFVFDPEADTHILKPAPLDTKLAESVYYATVFYDAYAAMNPKYGAAPRTEEQVLFNRMQGFEETEGYGPQGYTELSAFQIAADEYVENRNWEARQEIRRRIRAAQDRKLSAPPGIVEEGTPTETTAGDILRNMATKGNKIAKELVKKLDLAFLDMVPVEYNPNINRSFYDGKKDRIVLAGNNDQIKMHEALHAALAHHINSNPESAREIEKLMDAFRKQAEAMGLQDAQSVKYALKSVHEFMSQALSDPLTQTILEAAPSKEAATGLRAFIQKIMKFFGLGPKFEGALNDVVAMAGRISQESSHQRMMEIMRAAQPVDGYPQTVQEAIARLQAGLNEVHHYGPERITEFDPTVSSLLHFFAAPVADVHKSGLWQPKVLSRFTIRPDAKFLEVQDSEAPLHAENIIEGLRGQVTEEELGSYFRRLGRAGDMDAQQDEAVRIARELGYDGIVYMNGAELEYLPTFGVFHQGVLEPVEEQDSIYYAPEGVETETKEGFELDLDQVDEKTKSITPPTFKDYLKRMGRDIQKKLSNYFEVTSEQLRKIDEKYMHQLRQYEYRAMRKTRTHLRMIEPFIQKLEGLSNKEYNRLHYMFLNPHIKDEKSGKTLHELGLAFLKKKNMLKEWLSVQAVLDNIEERADSVGYRFHRLPMYIPRTVTDYKGLRDFLIDRAVKEGDKPGLAFLHSLKKRAGKMTDDEQKAMWVQAVLRGSVPGVPQPKSVKTRSLNRVPLEAVQFYGRLEDALIGHVYEMNDRIEQRVTVGAGYLKRARLSKKMRRLEAERKKLEAKPKRTKDDDKRIKQIDKALTKLDARYDALPDILDEMAESLTDKLRDDDSLTPDQRIEVARLFNARFRQTGMHGALQELKNIGLMMTLGNPLAAITQLGDQALNIYKHGNLFKGDTHAFKGMFKAMSDRGFLDEMELDKSTREFAMGASTQILDKILTASGLKTMDLFGKNAFMLAANEKYKDMSREKFMEQWGAEGILVNAEAAWQSFQDGNVAENEDALYVLYSDLADMQPINLSETPPGYQELENGRIFYMLKTFAVKQVNNVMRESVQEWKKGNKQKAVVQTTALIMLLSLSGAGADEIKDIIIGREKSMSDHVVDNMFQLILMSKYNIDKGLQQGNFTQAVAQGMLPPTRYIDDMISDVGGFLSGDTTYKSLRNVPLGGRIIYSRFTPQGREKELSMQRQDILKDAREGKNMSSEIGRFNKLRRELGREGRENVKAITSDTLKRAREAERKKQLGL